MAKAARRKAVPAKKQPGWLSQSEMARSCGVSVQAFTQWGVQPVAKIGRYAYYTAADVLKNRIAKRESQLQPQLERDDGDVVAARARAELKWTEERAEYQRLKNAELRRELAPVGLLTWALSDLASQVTPLLTPIPGEIKRRIPKITNAELHVMREVIANALNLVAEVRLDFDAYEPDGESPGD